MAKKKETIGLIEKIRIIGSRKAVKTMALFDTGATRTSVDMKIAAAAGLGPVVSSVKVKSKTTGVPYIRRVVVEGFIKVKGKKLKVNMNLEDREKMPYKVLVGRDVIHNSFIIDVSKTHASHKIVDLRENKN